MPQTNKNNSNIKYNVAGQDNVFKNSNEKAIFEKAQNNPFVKVERWNKETLNPQDVASKTNNNKKGQSKSSLYSSNKIRTRKIFKRSVALSVLYIFLTFGIYGLFWQYEIAKETKVITKDNNGPVPALTVFLSIITLGIYAIYWGYQIGLKQSKFLNEKKGTDSGCQVLYLILLIFNYVFPVLWIVAFAFMQSNQNKILKIAQVDFPDGLYTTDNSIFNRPVISTVLLLVIAEIIPTYIVLCWHMMCPGVPGSFVSDFHGYIPIFFESDVQVSIDQITYVNSPFMIAHSILSISVILFILWWFKLRFKHANYTGVLVLRNFGRACLIGLPGLFFVAVNCLNVNLGNLTFGIILFGFVPAFTEEILFRGMIIPNWMRIYNNSKGIWISLICSSVIFSAAHIGNVFSGANLGMSIFQASYTLSLAFLLAATLIRTGNLWMPIIIHGLMDLTSFMSDIALEQGLVQTQNFEFSPVLIPFFVICAGFILYGFWLCRPKKHEQICKLWADKWGSAVINK